MAVHKNAGGLMKIRCPICATEGADEFCMACGATITRDADGRVDEARQGGQLVYRRRSNSALAHEHPGPARANVHATAMRFTEVAILDSWLGADSQARGAA